MRRRPAGPLFSFGAYSGRSRRRRAAAGAALATIAIFLPGMLLVLAALPVLRRLRGRPGIAAALAGTNAVVVGLLAAALVTPVGTGGLTSVPAAILAALGVVGLVSERVPPLAVVAGCALAMAGSPRPAWPSDRAGYPARSCSMRSSSGSATASHAEPGRRRRGGPRAGRRPSRASAAGPRRARGLFRAVALGCRAAIGA